MGGDQIALESQRLCVCRTLTHDAVILFDVSISSHSFSSFRKLVSRLSNLPPISNIIVVKSLALDRSAIV